MALVQFTQHLPALFPQLQRPELVVSADTVAGVVQELEALAPGVAFYICDERGRLRQHVNIFVNNELVVDRQRLSDALEPASKVFVAQALSGG